MVNALKAYVEETKRFEFLTQSVTAAQKSVDLVMQLYNIGLTDFQHVSTWIVLLPSSKTFMPKARGLLRRTWFGFTRPWAGGREPEIPEESEKMEQTSGDSKP